MLNDIQPKKRVALGQVISSCTFQSILVSDLCSPHLAAVTFTTKLQAQFTGTPHKQKERKPQHREPPFSTSCTKALNSVTGPQVLNYLLYAPKFTFNQSLSFHLTRSFSNILPKRFLLTKHSRPTVIALRKKNTYHNVPIFFGKRYPGSTNSCSNCLLYTSDMSLLCT